MVTINWFIIGVVMILVIILIIYLIKRNLKDENELETFLNENELPLEEDDQEINNER